MGLILLLFILITIYSFFIVHLCIGFGKVKKIELQYEEPKTAFTLVVPFRNESKNLKRLLHSFSELDYPHDLIEIIMIDDESTDDSERVFIEWRMHHNDIDTTLLENLRLSNSPKKDAISRALPIAKHQWIITTDADCVVHKKWLKTFDAFIQSHEVSMIAGPVIFKTKNNWFHQFQQLDLLSLQGVTIGSFGNNTAFMCNGANFAYTKKLFYEVDGFNGNTKISSGDDVFLLQKAIAQFPEKVSYLKHNRAIVKTNPENDLYDFFMQRIRWAAKTTGYQSNYAKTLAVVVFLMNLGLIVGLVAALSGNLAFEVLVLVFFLKYTVDYLLLAKANAFFRKKKIILPIASSLMYPFYSVIIGIFAAFGGYVWKGRKFNR